MQKMVYMQKKPNEVLMDGTGRKGTTMMCNKCGTENKDEAPFCANCGARREKPEQARQCPACGSDSSAEGRFCARCGAEVRRHRNGHHDQHHHGQQVRQKHQKTKDRRVNIKLMWHPALVTIVLLAGVFVFTMSTELFVKKRPSPPPQLLEARSPDAKLEGKVMEIASKFICSCGTCGEKPLDTCTCNRAVEERQFIRNYLEQGQNPDQTIVALNKTYGWIKPEFAAIVGDSTAKDVAAVTTNLRKAKAGRSSPLGTFENIGGPAKRATAADRLEIFSRFQCPCGQCGVDELKDCGCRHPRGATEVKAFVDARIAEGKYTVAQLMDVVDAKYGGRKF
jgi:cytochrome c-type biogenesis protein CcmH/NrfF